MNLRVALLFLLAAAGARADLDPALARGSLAVLDFKSDLAGNVLSPEDVRYFADSARGAALKTVPGLHVMTRENLLVLLQATGKDLASCEGECEVETGRRIGADLIISGDLLKIGSNFKLNLRLHETHNGQLLSGEIASGKSVDELDARTAEAVARLLKPVQALAGNAPLVSQAGDAAPLISPANNSAPSAPAPASAAPAASSGAAPADSGSTAHRHLGFLLRADLGIGYMASGETDFTISGAAGAFAIQLGYAVWEDNIFGVSVYDAVAINPSVSTSSGDSGSIDGTSLTALGYGLNYTHYFMPLNLYVTATLAVTTISTSNSTAGSSFTSGAGFGLRLEVGKEWWLSEHWGIGAVAQFSYAGNSDSTGAGITTTVFTLAASATYN